MVLSAVCLNTICFLVVTMDLYAMTKDILLFHCRMQEKYKEKTKLSSSDCETWPRRVALLFVCNPANVFFGTAYSEALCAALLCHGCRWALQMVLTSAASNQKDSVSSTWLTMLGATGIWWLAALTRSNSTLYGGFLLLYGAGLVLRRRRGPWLWLRRSFVACYVLVLIVFLIYGSMGWHNFRGYSMHCVEFTGIRPTWCEQGPWFNLYGYVQKKYWSVGFLRYFQIKQIPNFLLACPILVLSTLATSTWIQTSWTLLIDNQKSVLQRTISWIVDALQAFGGEQRPTAPLLTPGEILQGSSYLLGFYAVLAASTLLGLTIAHVQISTRLICSSCPALYWFLAGALNRRFGDAIIGYFLFYNILGVILHPNWLPWT
jgi:phosphatidylinositol glycan class V